MLQNSDGELFSLSLLLAFMGGWGVQFPDHVTSNYLWIKFLHLGPTITLLWNCSHFGWIEWHQWLVSMVSANPLLDSDEKVKLKLVAPRGHSPPPHSTSPPERCLLSWQIRLTRIPSHSPKRKEERPENTSALPRFLGLFRIACTLLTKSWCSFVFGKVCSAWYLSYKKNCVHNPEHPY